MNIFEAPFLAHHTISFCFTLHWMIRVCLGYNMRGVKAKKQVGSPREETSEYEVTESRKHAHQVQRVQR